MANQIFKYLNFDKSIVMKILHWNYGKINFWKDQIPSSCSWFFRGLYNSAIYLWPLCRINLVNPLDTSFLMDLWCFDIPIALKPTFININIDFDHFNISNLIQENNWNSTNLYHVLGNNFENNSPIINLIIILPTIIGFCSLKPWVLKFLLQFIIFLTTTLLLLIIGLNGVNYGLLRPFSLAYF